jgi:signal transduction histidine kinase/CheY-like chemotaxis protein
MATTFIALLACVGTILIYDLRTYHNDAVKDVTTQANIIAEISAPALEFNDPISAKENLQALKTRPSIVRAAIFTPSQKIFAHYEVAGEHSQMWPDISTIGTGHSFDGDRIYAWQVITKNNETLGVVYLCANYESHERLINYAVILGSVMCGCLALALLIAIWLGRTVTNPIFAVTNVALDVMQERDFSLRAKKFTEDEIGVLVDAFNDMLTEVERRTGALETSNDSLAREMAERTSAEAALRVADVRKDEFLATLAHELRNPLASLSNSLEILRLVKDRPDLAENSKIVMDRQLKQMVRLVNDLLDVSRINTGKLAISKSRVDLSSIIRDAIESSDALIKSCCHKLTVELPEASIDIDADSLRLAQVFSNILNNAAKYTDRGGKIRVAVSINESEVTVSISDTGIGIAKGMQENIFKMFTQVDQSLERSHAGLGVGLALAKHLTELHGYELSVKSDGVGKGSTFSVRLPVASSAKTHADDVAATEFTSVRKRIMLVDDNADFATSMGSLLESLGNEVRIAHDGFVALKIAHEFVPDIAFLDIGMPEMSGYELAKRLRHSPENQTTILVAVTGWGQEKDVQLSRDAGFNHHLVKPVNLGQLVALINKEFS